MLEDQVVYIEENKPQYTPVSARINAAEVSELFGDLGLPMDAFPNSETLDLGEFIAICARTGPAFFIM